MAAGKRSINLQIRRFSWVYRFPTNFGISNGQLGLNFCCQIPWADLGVSPHFYGSDGQKHGKFKVFQGWLFTGKFNDFSDFQVSTNFGVCHGKLGLEGPLPNSTVKMCNLHWAAGGPQKHEKSKIFDGCCWKREHSLDDFRGFTISASPIKKLGLEFLSVNSANKMWHLH